MSGTRHHEGAAPEGMATNGASAHARLCAVLARRLGAGRAQVMALPMGEVLSLLPLAGAVMAEPLTHERPLACTDLRVLGKQAREEGRALVVDNSSATFVGCAAVRLGAHLSIEPLCTGETPTTLVGFARDASRALPDLAALDGPPTPPDELCQELLDSLPQHEAAWRASSDLAQVVASYLACHPRVAQVRYPGLRSDPSFEVAARTLTGGFGPWVDYQQTDASGWVRWEASPHDDPREAVLALEAGLR